jgi:hypothetical protein
VKDALCQYRILVSGSRDWPESKDGRATVHSAVLTAADNMAHPTVDGAWPTVTLVHGDARGLDRMAAQVGRELGMQVEGHPADWVTCSPDCRPGHRKTKNGREYCPDAGPRRNQEMVDLGADVVLGFPLGSGWSGTRHCMDAGRKAGLHVITVTSSDIPGSGDA